MRKNTKFIKRTLSALMVASLTIALVGCGNASEDVVEDVSEEIVQEEMVETEVAANVEVPTEVVEEETEESTEEESTEESAKKEETEKKKNEESKTVAKNENSGSTTTAPVQGTGHENPEYTTQAYEGVSYYTNTQTPMHLANDGERWYYVVDSFNRYALNEYLTNGDYGRWTNIPHGDEWDAWLEIEEGRATFKDGVYTPYPGNGDFLQMDDVLNIDGQGGPVPGLTNPISRHPEGGGCYYFHYNTDYSYVSTTFRIWDREKLALITPDYLGVENLLYNWMFNGTDKFGPNCDQPEYVGNTKIEYLGKVPTSNFEYIFRISQR